MRFNSKSSKIWRRALEQTAAKRRQSKLFLTGSGQKHLSHKFTQRNDEIKVHSHRSYNFGKSKFISGKDFFYRKVSSSWKVRYIITLVLLPEDSEYFLSLKTKGLSESPSGDLIRNMISAVIYYKEVYS